MILGSLRQKLILQEQTLTPAGGGTFTSSWADIATLWGELKPQNGEETVFAERMQATQKWRVRVRYRPDISPSHRLLWRGEILNIRAVRDSDGRQRFLIIDAEQGVAT